MFVRVRVPPLERPIAGIPTLDQLADHLEMPSEMPSDNVPEIAPEPENAEQEPAPPEGAL